MIPGRRLAGFCITLVASAAGLVVVESERIRLGQLAPALVTALPALVSLLTAAIGAWLIYLGWPRRVGRGLYCKQCGYYQEDRGRIAPSCPECGAAWRWIGNHKAGRPIGTKELVALGILLCMLAWGASLVPHVAPWVMLRFMSDDVLLSQLAILPDEVLTDAWAELERRKVPTARLDQLAGALLKKKSRDGYLSGSAERVLFDAAMSATAAPELSQRYFSSLIAGDLKVRPKLTVGETLEIKGVAEFRGSATALSGEPRVLVLSALFLGDDPTPLETWVWAVQPGSGAVQARNFVHRLSVESAGALQLRQEFWLAVGPPGNDEVTWAAGKPVLPPSMSLKDTFGSSREVIVEPSTFLRPTRPR